MWDIGRYFDFYMHFTQERPRDKGQKRNWSNGLDLQSLLVRPKKKKHWEKQKRNARLLTIESRKNSVYTALLDKAVIWRQTTKKNLDERGELTETGCELWNI